MTKWWQSCQFKLWGLSHTATAGTQKNWWGDFLFPLSKMTAALTAWQFVTAGSTGWLCYKAHYALKAATSDVKAWVTGNAITRPEFSWDGSVRPAAASACNVRLVTNLWSELGWMRESCNESHHQYFLFFFLGSDLERCWFNLHQLLCQYDKKTIQAEIYCATNTLIQERTSARLCLCHITRKLDTQENTQWLKMPWVWPPLRLQRTNHRPSSLTHYEAACQPGASNVNAFAKTKLNIFTLNETIARDNSKTSQETVSTKLFLFFLPKKYSHWWGALRALHNLSSFLTNRSSLRKHAFYNLSDLSL